MGFDTESLWFSGIDFAQAGNVPSQGSKTQFPQNSLLLEFVSQLLLRLGEGVGGYIQLETTSVFNSLNLTTESEWAGDGPGGAGGRGRREDPCCWLVYSVLSLYACVYLGMGSCCRFSENNNNNNKNGSTASVGAALLRS